MHNTQKMEALIQEKFDELNIDYLLFLCMEEVAW